MQLKCLLKVAVITYVLTYAIWYERGYQVSGCTQEEAF